MGRSRRRLWSPLRRRRECSSLLFKLMEKARFCRAFSFSAVHSMHAVDREKRRVIPWQMINSPLTPMKFHAIPYVPDRTG